MIISTVYLRRTSSRCSSTSFKMLDRLNQINISDVRVKLSPVFIFHSGLLLFVVLFFSPSLILLGLHEAA